MEPDLRTALKRLEEFLTEKQAAIVDQLLPGLAPKRVREITASLPVQLEPEVVALYSWHNGTRDSEKGMPELFPGGTFLNLAEAVVQYNLRVDAARSIASPEEVTEVYDASWFPLFLDAGGNLHVSATQPRALAGSIWFVPLEEPQLRYTVAGSLSQFIALIIELYGRGAYVVEADGSLSSDYRAVATVMRQRIAPQTSVATLVADLGSNDSQQALRAFDTIRRMLFPEAAEPLIEATRARDPILRRRAVLLLGMLSDSSAAVAALEAALDDQNSGVRSAAQSALQQLHRPATRSRSLTQLRQ